MSGGDPSLADKPLSAWSDAELDAELKRRRSRRGQLLTDPVGPDRGRAAGAPAWKVRQWYRNLELEPGASREDVDEAYARLTARYSPDKHADDPEKHRAAQRLIAGLEEAYFGIVRSLDAPSAG
ncbi:MAG: DnaJ domain-containing protein [Sandaracinaceae bacterium]